MAINAKYIPVLREIVSELVNGNFEVLEKDGRSGRLTANEIRTVINQYGCTLAYMDDGDFGLADVYPVSGKQNECSIDLPLKTVEEGRSDLTLSLTLKDAGGCISLEIDDIHVL